MDKYFYIYNRHQANFFISKGLRVLEFNKGKKDDYYVKFSRNEISEEIFKGWLVEKQQLKQLNIT